MTFGTSRRSPYLFQGLVIAALIVAAITAVAIPVACRARRARWVAQLGSAARERLAAGETVEAMKLYGLYLQKSPDDAAAHAAYATLMRKQAELPGSGRRQREAALAAINDAVRKNPESLPLRRMLAVSLLELGQFGTAREQLVILRDQAAAATPEALAAADIDLDEITLLEARTCLSTDMISDAAALAARLTGFDADGRVFDPAWKPGRFVTEASVLLATILSEKGEDPRAAERVLAKLTETAPDDHRAWLALARWHAGHGDPRRAADEIARATTLAPDSRDVLAAGFAMALSDGRFDEAARQARRMCELFPELPDGGLCLAEVAVRRGAPQEALEPLQTALERLPDNPAVLLSLANAQLLAGRLDDAGRTIRGLVERATRPNPAVGMLEARLLVARRQWLAAVKKLDAVRPLAADSDDAKRQIDMLLAECHANLGQADEQLAAGRRLLGGDSGSVAARATAAAGLAASGKPEKALAEYESIARELGADRVVRQPQVWQPLLQLRSVHQLRLPVHERDWSQVVELLDSLEESGAVPAAELVVLRYDSLLAAGDPAASDFLTRALEDHGDEPQLWERLVVATGRQEGLAAALRRLESLPAGVVDDPRLLMLRARLAARAPEAEADEILLGVEAKAAALSAEQSGRLLAAVAAVRAARGDQAGAERVWQALLASNPDDLPTHFARFEQAYERRDAAKAAAAAEAICRLCGSDTANGRAVKAATLLLEAARGGSRSAAARDGGPAAGKPAAEDAARLEAARNMLVEAENERPGWPLLQRLGADLELMRGDVPAAIARLEKGVALSPESLSFLRPLVTLLAASNRQARACELLRQISGATGDTIASEDLRVWARRTLAEVVARSGGYRDVEEAVAGLARNQDRDGKPALQDMSLGIAILAGRPEPAAWRQAISGFAALAERRPLTDAERMQRAELLERAGMWEECRADVIELAARPDLPPFVLAMAVDMLIRHGDHGDHGDLEQAAAGLKTLADREPAGAGVLVLEARLALARGDTSTAVAAVRRLAAAEASSTDGPRRLLAAATLLEECGESDEADKLFARLADQSATGVLARVDFLARRGRTAEAIDMLQANRQRLGTERFMKSAVAVVRTADGEAAADQVKRVAEWLAAAEKGEKDTVGGSLLQAEFSASQGRREEAAKLYRQLLGRRDLAASDRAIVQNNLAMQLVSPDTAAEAKQLIEQALAEQGPHPSLLDTQGLALLAGGASQEAVTVLREAALDKSAEKSLHLALALVATGDTDEARQVFVAARERGLDRGRLDADDRKRLADVEAALDLPAAPLPGGRRRVRSGGG